MSPRERAGVTDRFFPEGREQWETSPEYQRRRQDAIAAVDARYAPLLAGAGPIRRLWLLWQRRRAIERELETLSPTDACFLTAPSSPEGKAPLAVAALALLPLLVPAPALGEPPMAVEIERKVEADVFEGPVYPSAEGGAGPACPRGLSKPRTGDSVVLTVAPQMGRRDQPDFSLVVRLDRGVAYLLFHPERSFAQLEAPFKEPPFPFPVKIDKETQRRLAPRLLHPVAPERRTLGVLQAVVSSNVVGDENRPHADIEAVYEAEPRPLAGVSHRLDEFFQDMGPGSSWLRLLGEQGGLLLGWAQATHLPEDKVHYRERFTASREVPARPDLFEPPGGYRRVKLDPICFLGL